MEAHDEIPDLLRRAKAQEKTVQAAVPLQQYADANHRILAWHRDAGRAFAWEGLETAEFNRQIELWIGRERLKLRDALRSILA